MVKMVFRITVPDELVQPLLQVIRDFDMKHDPNHEGKVHFDSLAESEWPEEQWRAILEATHPRPQYLYTKKADS